MLKKTVSSLILLAFCSAPLIAAAQDRDDHHDDAHHQQYVRHEEWKRGYRMHDDDWNRGERVDDWKAHHLNAPRKGYEWRQIDGNYVQADNHGVITTVRVVPR